MACINYHNFLNDSTVLHFILLKRVNTKSQQKKRISFEKIVAEYRKLYFKKSNIIPDILAFLRKLFIKVKEQFLVESSKQCIKQQNDTIHQTSSHNKSKLSNCFV